MSEPRAVDRLIAGQDEPEIPAADVAPTVELPADLVVLSLDDLLPDPQGEIVVLDDAADGVAIATGGRPITEQGVSEPHVTATGVEVGGLAYCTFSDGLTLYYPSTMRVIVEPDAV